MATKTAFALAALAVVAAAGAAEGAQAKADWLYRRQASGTSLLAAVNNEKCENKVESCADCTTVRTCVNVMDKWVEYGTTACPTSTPYCQDGKCQKDAPSQACSGPAVDTTFDCPSDGYWPDQRTCTKYYLCVGDKAYALDCSAFPRTVYDHRTARCVPRSRVQCYSLRCKDFNEARRTPVYTPYAPAPWVYAVCTSKDAATAIVGACAEGKAMNAATGLCEDACAAEGRFKDTKRGDDTSYYDCVDLGGGRLSKPIPNQCPDGTQFDADKGQCAVRPGPAGGQVQP